MSKNTALLKWLLLAGGNTSFGRNRHSILSFLFLLYFAVYAISPLSATYTVKKVVDRICPPGESSHSVENLNILLLEVIYSKIDTKKDSGNSAIKVLIRKTRAILPEGVSSLSASSSHVTLPGSFLSIFDKSSSRLSVSSNEQKDIGEFNLLHSGPSPPTV